MYFNPRSLAGATKANRKALVSPLFQSTLPCGSDEAEYDAMREELISIHAPLRERHESLIEYIHAFRISIHAPLRERRMAQAVAKGA